MRAMGGWLLGYLLNSLWQVPLIFAATWLTARQARLAGPKEEHRIWVSALVAETLLPGVQLPVGEMARALWAVVLRAFSMGVEGGETQVVVQAGPGLVHGGFQLPIEWVAGVLVVYAGSLLYFAGRLAWAVCRTNAIRRQAEPVTLAGTAALQWERYARLFSCEGAGLACSPKVYGPVTVGGRLGVLLVPPGFCERVAEDDFDVVVAHEFAHMRRRDFAKNLLYALVTLPVSFHPVLWMTRTRLAESREMVCDAMAAEAVTGKERYARSLLRLAALIAQTRPAGNLHSIGVGIFDANLFERRLMQLMERRNEATGVRRLARIAVCVGIGVVTCGSAIALRMDVPFAQKEAGTVPETHGPRRVSGGVMAGQVLMKVAPVYPPDAKAAKIQGAVVLKAIISREGKVENLVVVSGPKELQRSALDSVRQWTYKPYLLNGEPVEVETNRDRDLLVRPVEGE